MLWSQIGYVVLFLAVGSLLRYVLPYVLKGLVEIGLERPWPKWKWKYFASFALAVLGFGLPMILSYEFFARLAAMQPDALMMFAYAGNEMSREVVKALQRLAAGDSEEEDE